MAFATKLVNKEVHLDQCTPLLDEKYKRAYLKLWDMLKPPVKEVVIGTGDRMVKIGGKDVLYRHELTYVNPTAIALDVTDSMTDEEFTKRLKSIEGFSFSYIGYNLTLDMVAIRSTSNDPQKFQSKIKLFAETSPLPAILCSFDPEIIRSGLDLMGKDRPLIYAATIDNWKEMADLAIMYHCPLTVYAPNDLDLLKSLVRTLLEYGVEDLVLDPGTFTDEGLADTLNNFTMLRKAAIKENDELLGFPLLGVPLTVWIDHEAAPEVAIWNETWLASMLITRFADVLIMHSLDGWSQLPLTILRKNLYTDPRKPVAVEAGFKTFGEPNAQSPLLFTTNFALTYYTVAADIESGGIDCYLLVIDTEGLALECAVAGRKLTADKVGEALKQVNAEDLVQHKMLIIPGRSARLSGEIEEASGWEVIVGPMDSSGIPKFVQVEWPKKLNA
jgi:acetyl-CoA decarbonylase/synthase complex subunit gamma